MATRKLSDFKSNIKNLGRPNRFKVSFSGPTAFTFDTTEQFLVRSAQLPGKTLGEIAGLTHFGMTAKMAGEPTYEDITLNFFNKADYALKRKFETWMESFANTIDNTRVEATEAVMTLQQLGLDNAVTTTYYCHGVWPKTVSAVEVSQDSQDEVEKFDVTFSMDYWSDTADGTGNGISKPASA